MNQMFETNRDRATRSAGLLLSLLVTVSASLPAQSMGMMAPHVVPTHVLYGHRPTTTPHRSAPAPAAPVHHSATAHSTAKVSATKPSHKKGGKKHTAAAKPVAAAKAIAPQGFIDNLNQLTLAPGVVHKFVRGPLSINVLDVDMKTAPIKVQPNLAGESFDKLKDVADHARESNAIAAINANYFKTNGTPLGTLIIDGEWVAGPLFDRVSMGISSNGDVKIDRVSLNGILSTNNPEVPTIWVNNINQPRRHGTHLMLYTRRWGSYVRMAYEGTLVAVNAQGEVQDKSVQTMAIPYGGYVLSDSKDSKIGELKVGDRVQVSWQTNPNNWSDVVEAVSGGPILVKDGQVYLDLKDENFRKNWTGSQIKARTAIGVTADRHLILATIEGPHTLWDFAKFLKQMGAVDAMNLDGGGSTTMVVQGKTVTRNANDNQRRVASSIVLVDLRNAADRMVGNSFRNGVTPAAASFGAVVPVPQVSTLPVAAPAPEATPPASTPRAVPTPVAETAQMTQEEEDSVLSPMDTPQEPIKPIKKKWFGLGH